MIEHKKDREATRLLYKSGHFEDRRSWVSYSGHEYLKGKDASNLHDRVFTLQDTCQICGKKLFGNRGDLEHIVGGRPRARCWCFNTMLADGTVHTNVRRSCPMIEPGSCHSKKHNREVKWSPRAKEE